MKYVKLNQHSNQHQNLHFCVIYKKKSYERKIFLKFSLILILRIIKKRDDEMFRIDEKQNIHVSRGDEMNFDVEFIDVESGEKYIFQSGDKLTFTVAKNLRKNYVFQLTKYISGPTESVNFDIAETLWLNECAYVQELEYDIILNDKFSVICYDLQGAKKLFLYPRTYERGES